MFGMFCSPHYVFLFANYQFICFLVAALLPEQFNNYEKKTKKKRFPLSDSQSNLDRFVFDNKKKQRKKNNSLGNLFWYLK